MIYDQSIFDGDLAFERRRADTALEGVAYRETTEDGFPVTSVRIEHAAGAKAIGRPCGTYLTCSFEPMFRMEQARREDAVRLLSRLLRKLLSDTEAHHFPASSSTSKKGEGGKEAEQSASLLVVGIGKSTLTSDALGPQTVLAIRERQGEIASDRLRTLIPGTEEETGVSSAEVIASLCRLKRPRAVIVIDALRARSLTRLASAIQLSDTGIVPGSGVREAKSGVTYETVGCPVLSVGIPTVVSVSTLLAETIAVHEEEEALARIQAELSGARFFVSPQDIDDGVRAGASLIADTVLTLCQEDTDLDDH